MTSRSRCVFVGLAFFSFTYPVTWAADRPAVFEIGGYGLWGNLQLKRAVRLLQPERKPPPFYDANFVEDAALMMLSTLMREGYLHPRVTARLTLADGHVAWYLFDESFTTTLPRPMQVKRVRFRIQRGVLYHYSRIRFVGLHALSEGEARKYFVEPEFLIALKRARVYTPDRLDASIRNLTEAYARRGFQQAKLTAQNVTRNDKTGVVRLTIHSAEGRRTFARSVRVEVFEPGRDEPRQVPIKRVQKPYSEFWRQDFAQKLKTQQFKRGYPDAQVSITVSNRDVGETSIQLDLRARIQTGPLVRVGKVIFEGNTRTKTTVLRPRVKLKPSDKLDRVQAENDRLSVARLGVFESVELRLQPLDETTRNVIYDFIEGKTIEWSLLFGYGSYERLRGGIELSQYNLFGLAHQSRLRLTQSFKSSSGDYLYTVPAFIGGEINFFGELTALRRQEISFLREEYGASVGAQRHVGWLDSDVSLRYSYQYLNAGITQTQLMHGVERALVGAVVLDVRHDHRDNPLAPRRGYNAFGNIEIASRDFGGEVDYQRLQLTGSYHHGLGGGRYLHAGISHGAAFSGEADDLPFNKRFFPGGENSVRGFQEGEASPRDAKGKIIGAESFLQGNLELEQYIVPTWSVVAFVDGVGFAERVRDYPFDEVVYSVGGGLRWKTVVGPLRLEYGYNPKRRPHDPTGTLHVSLGFPF
jgi:outer membrane protein insertion porin family